MTFKNITGLTIGVHPQSKRLISINILQSAIDELTKKNVLFSSLFGVILFGILNLYFN